MGGAEPGTAPPVCHSAGSMKGFIGPLTIDERQANDKKVGPGRTLHRRQRTKGLQMASLSGPFIAMLRGRTNQMAVRWTRPGGLCTPAVIAPRPDMDKATAADAKGQGGEVLTHDHRRRRYTWGA